jgi:hypothetical protein
MAAFVKPRNCPFQNILLPQILIKTLSLTTPHNAAEVLQ